jgi:hypothetical protein
MQRQVISEASACAVLIALTLISVLPLLAALDRTLPWIDEVFFASTSISVMNGHSATPAVFQAFHNTGRVDLFYGPVAIRLGAIWFKLWGVSMWKWRLLPFTGGVSIIVLAGGLVAALSGNGLLTLIAVWLVALCVPLGSAIDSGRPDTIAVAFQLLGLVFLVLSVRRNGMARYLFSISAGAAVASALLSTPRSLPFCMGLAVGGVGLLYLGGLRCWSEVLLPAATVGITTISVWTHSEGLSPWRWFRFISRSSLGDSGNVSPLLGGEWGFEKAFFVPTFATIAILIFVACCLFWLWVREHAHGPTIIFSPGSAFVLITGLSNTVLTIALLSRALSYEIFFVVPLICGLLVVSAELLKKTKQVRVGWLVFSAWILFALVGVAVRIVKLTDVYLHWSSRDPAPLRTIIRANIPADSLVFGLDPVYFWAVQESNASYIWIKELTNPGLTSGTPFDAQSTLRQSGRSQAFVLWTDGEPLPAALSSLIGNRSVPVRTQNSKADRMSIFRPSSMRANYPPAHLYEISLLNARNQ